MSPIHDERFQGKRPEKKLDPQKFSILRTPDTTTEPVRGNASPVATVSVSSSRTRASKARFLAEGVGQDRPLTLDDHAALAYQAGFDERERQRQVAREREERERIAEANRRKTEAAHAEARRIAEQRDKEYLAQRDVALSIAKQMLAERIEADLVTSQAAMVLEGMNATVDEAKEVARRLRSQGLEKLPDAYRWDLERLRSERK